MQKQTNKQKGSKEVQWNTLKYSSGHQQKQMNSPLSMWGIANHETN